MKRLLLSLLIALANFAGAASFDADTALPVLKPTQQQSQAAHLAAEVLTRYHYKPQPLDDALSKKIFDRYLKTLDPDKLFFLKSDVEQFAALRTRLDNAILDEDLAPPFALFNLYVRRVAERYGYARRLLRDGFDFSQKESYAYARDKEASWPASDDELRDLWRRRVKNDWLRLKLAGKDDKAIVETLDKRYENVQKRVARSKGDDAFQVFMNAYTMAIEPHTAYMGLRAAEDFDISMRLSLVGIGASLSEKDDYTTIRELIAGGPAITSGLLKVGDRIVGVAQGDGPMVDIQGWRLDDSVALIRGAANSVVRLAILPADAGPDGKHKVVSLVRKKISLEAQAAQKSVFSVRDGDETRRIGVVTLPAFYQDFEARARGERNFRSATRDVARLLGELKKEKVDGVLVDLRNNGGGSLTEAIELTGLFVGKGPVVQQRDARGRVVVEGETRAATAWSGPLAVLINRSSASASEIFAAAIQDYGRGVVIGEPSFGKGTVQSVVNLDRIAETDKPKYGELTLTVAQFFRIDGSSTQLIGVKPDIVFPEIVDEDEFGESSFDNALPSTRIKPASYTPAGNVNMRRAILLARHQARARADKDFVALAQDIAEVNRLRKIPTVSLNEAERRRELEAQEARAKAREKKDGRNGALRDDGLQDDERQLSVELAEEKERRKAKDVFLAEAVNILGDEVALQKSPVPPTTAGAADAGLANMASARPVAGGKAGDSSTVR